MTALIRLTLVLAALLPTLLSTVAAAATPCDPLQSRLGELEADRQQWQQRAQQLESVLAGTWPTDLTLSDTIATPLDQEREINARLQGLAATLPAPVLDKPLRDCPQAQRWQALQADVSAARQHVRTLERQLLEQPRAIRLALSRLMLQWEQIQGLEATIGRWFEEQAAPSPLELEVNTWIDDWRTTATLWLPHLLDNTRDRTISNDIWRTSLQLLSPDELQVAPGEVPDSLWTDWHDRLNQAYIALVREVSRWRNEQVRAAGWWAMLSELKQPLQFGAQLQTELMHAPRLLMDAVTRPFLRDYRYAVLNENRGELLSSWFLQITALVVLLSALLRLGSAAALQLTRWHGRLNAMLQRRLLSRVVNAIFWILKPNVYWLLVWIGAYSIDYFVPNNWYLLDWIGTCGAILAVYRLVCVVLGWIISRGYIRSEQFLPSHIAQSQREDIRRISWVVVAGIVLWKLVSSTGGGYLLYLIIILDAIMAWLVIFWLMWRYRQAAARFMVTAFSNSRGDAFEARVQRLQRGWPLPFWPLLFILAQLWDMLINLREYLLHFDAYRSLAVKLMRLRMAAEKAQNDSASSDKASAETEPPEHDYKEWMLRGHPQLWIEISGLERVLTPLKDWSNSPQDDNVLLIVGDQGSGKSSLVQRLSRTWESTALSTLPIPAKTTAPSDVFQLLTDHLAMGPITSVADLVKLDDQLERRIIVLEDVHNLFISEVGMLDGYRTLAQCLNAHLNNIFWVVVMHAPSWNYLSCVFSRELRFSNIFRMPRWSPADIRKLILSSHQGSQRQLTYTDPLLAGSRDSDSAAMRAAASRIFNILWDQSGGNPGVALQLWLAAAQTQDRRVQIGVPERPSSTRLKGIADDVAFIYAAIMTHKALNSDEIIAATHYAEPIVRHALKQGVFSGILQHNDDNRYRLSPRWQQTIYSVLSSKNMMWSM